MKFKLKPYEWQMNAIGASDKIPNLALLAEMGTGKTGALINILRLRYGREKRVMKTLILSPLVTLLNWEDEFKIHSYIEKHDVKALYKGGGAGKAKLMLRLVSNPITKELDRNMILITNYESLQNKHFHELLMEWGPEILVCDESHVCKNPTAKRSKSVVRIADRCKHKYIMTGTPILNNVKDIFNQFRILDGGETFGKNFHVFMSTYMEDENAGWKGKPGHFPKWVTRPEMYEHLTKLIYQKAIRVLKKDCLDLPPLIKEKRSVELSQEQRKYYEEMKRDFITFVEQEEQKEGASPAVVAQIAATKALRLMQITTGYMQTDDGETIDIKNNPRLEATGDLLDELIPNHKVILWCSFRHNYKQLAKLCEKKNIEHVFIVGGMTLDAKKSAMDRFEEDPKVRVIIANRLAGGIGVNLVAASYSIVYSRNFSLGEELQSEARNYRGGSERHGQIVKIDLVARDTIDEDVLEALRNKDDISKRVIDIVRKGGKK